MIELELRTARRLALACAGLLKDEWTGLPARARPRGPDAVRRTHRVIERFGYLQLDAVSVTGARSHSIVMASRLDGLAADTVEGLLHRDAPLFEYWGHEACWLPMDLYPAFAFRRRAFAVHPWWGDLLTQHRPLADDLLARVRDTGGLRSLDLDGERGAGWWNLKLAKRVAEALWSSGELAIAERNSFQRVYDLPERVIPAAVREAEWSDLASIEVLALRALAGHGWATTSTIGNTWRLRGFRDVLAQALARLRESGDIVECEVRVGKRRLSGWLLASQVGLAAGLESARIHASRPVLLSPFDPVLWDRQRAALLFGFQHLLEIYKPAEQRRYGYYVLPVLAGDRFVSRLDLKARRASGQLEVLARHDEPAVPATRVDAAVDKALARFASSVGLALA